MLRVRNLTIRFPSSPLTGGCGFSFDLHRGEILGLTGPSGCGKTVFCTALLGMLEAPGYIAGGSIHYVPEGGRNTGGISGELDLTALTEREWRRLRGREISLIFQNPHQSLNHARTIGAQFAEVITVHGPRRSRREKEDLARSALADAGLPDSGRILKSYPFELSGGMCQRVIIAMALVHLPAVLIADEPTTALDKKNEAQIISLFQKIRETQGTAILLVSHDEELIRAATDRTIRRFNRETDEL